MKIIVNEKNKKKIETCIAEAEGRATVRTITFEQIEYAIERIEKELDITAKYMRGVTACVDPNAQDFPRAYKYTPQSTWVKLERCASGWAVIGIWRDITASPSHAICVSLTKEAKEAIIENKTKFEF